MTAVGILAGVLTPALLALGALFAVTTLTVAWLVCGTWREVRALDRHATHGTRHEQTGHTVTVTRTTTEQLVVTAPPPVTAMDAVTAYDQATRMLRELGRGGYSGSLDADKVGPSEIPSGSAPRRRREA